MPIAATSPTISPRNRYLMILKSIPKIRSKSIIKIAKIIPIILKTLKNAPEFIVVRLKFEKI